MAFRRDSKALDHSISTARAAGPRFAVASELVLADMPAALAGSHGDGWRFVFPRREHRRWLKSQSLLNL